MSTAFTRRRESREIKKNKQKKRHWSVWKMSSLYALANIGYPFMLTNGGKDYSDWSDILILPVEKQKRLMGCCRKPETRHLWTEGLGPAPVTNMKRNMGAGEKERVKQRERERDMAVVERWKGKKDKSNMLVATAKNNNDFLKYWYSYTKCEHSEQWTQVTIHFLCMPLTLTIKRQTNIKC